MIQYGCIKLVIFNQEQGFFLDMIHGVDCGEYTMDFGELIILCDCIQLKTLKKYLISDVV